jgi:ketosteroid isomerase-like protein
MSAEKNKALVRRFLEAHAKGDLDVCCKVHAHNSLMRP